MLKPVPVEYILATSRIFRRRKFKLAFFLDSSFKLVFWLDTTLKLANSQMLLNVAVVHDRVICEPPDMTELDLSETCGPGSICISPKLSLRLGAKIALNYFKIASSFLILSQINLLPRCDCWECC
jgi:hypothetical protein